MSTDYTGEVYDALNTGDCKRWMVIVMAHIDIFPTAVKSVQNANIQAQKIWFGPI